MTGMMLGPGLLESPMSSSFTTSPIRFVDFTLEVSNISKDYGTDFAMTFRFDDTDSRIGIGKDGGGPIWTIGGADDPVGPDMPQWHEDYPTSPTTYGHLYEAAYISTVSWSGLAQGLNDVRWAGWSDPDSRAPEWVKLSLAQSQASIVENPAGNAHTSEWVAIFQIRRISDSEIMAQAEITMRAIYT